MASGEARKLHKSKGLPVVIVGRDGRPTWSEVWEGVPYILRRRNGRHSANHMINAGGARPYIVSKTPEKWVWRAYTPVPAEIVFTAAELAFAESFRGLVMLEPNGKAIGHDNKLWLWDRWQALANTRKDFVQCGPPGTRWLDGGHAVITPTFRLAAAVLSVCRAFVGGEGGMMHAAAAVGTPAVILWSEFISPEITGYSTMRNIRHAGKACGMRTNCPGCRKSMEAITVQEAARNLEEIL